MEIYCKHCGAFLEGEVHIFDEMYFCNYDCLENYIISNTEIDEIKYE